MAEEQVPEIEISDEEEAAWHQYMAGGKADGSDRPGPVVGAKKMQHMLRPLSPDKTAGGSDW